MPRTVRRGREKRSPDSVKPGNRGWNLDETLEYERREAAQAAARQAEWEQRDSELSNGSASSKPKIWPDRMWAIRRPLARGAEAFNRVNRQGYEPFMNLIGPMSAAVLSLAAARNAPHNRGEVANLGEARIKDFSTARIKGIVGRSHSLTGLEVGQIELPGAEAFWVSIYSGAPSADYDLRDDFITSKRYTQPSEDIARHPTLIVPVKDGVSTDEFVDTAQRAFQSGVILDRPELKLGAVFPQAGREEQGRVYHDWNGIPAEALYAGFFRK